MARVLEGVGTGPFGAFRALIAGTARRSQSRVRATVIVAIVLIAGSFAAAAALQMRFDRLHALNQATWYETRHADDVAVLADAALDRLAFAGRAYADNGKAPILPGLRNIAVFDSSGAWGSVLYGTAVDFPEFPPALLARAARSPSIAAPSIIAFPFKRQIIVVAFDPRELVPADVLQRSSIATVDGSMIASGPSWVARDTVSARGRSWPIAASTSMDKEAALYAWYGSLPLYLFVIVGPALVGAFLAALFVGEFERRVRAANAVRALRSVRPAEGRLLVRLAQAERFAVESTRAKAEFMANMSHELRTPLNAIIGFAEVIQQQLFGAGNAKYTEYAHDIADAGRHLHARIGEILEFANVDTGRVALKPERFEVCEIARQLIEEHQGRAFSQRISLTFGDVVPVAAIADVQATKRALSILIANALTYTPRGGAVRVDVRDDEGAAVISVCDTGSGFARDELHRIGGFVRFKRPGSVNGAGLGLAIATALARHMGGALSIGGDLGRGGAVVELRLPRAPRIP